MANRTATEPAARVSQRQALWLLAASAASALPLLPGLRPAIAALAVTLLAISIGVWIRARALPARWIVFALVAGSTLAIGFAYRSLFGREPGVAMLIVFLALKLLELRTTRDGFTLVLLCYFLQLALLFDRQGPEIAAYLAADLILITAALIQLERDGQKMRSSIARASRMLAQATPLMLVLFVLFPRVQGPLWGLPRDAWAGMSGLSDTMSPGSIRELSLSAEPAFRVKFAGSTPPHAALYWRGPVLTHYDGRTWRAAPGAGSRTLPYETSGPAVEYTVTLEPHDKPWLFALDLPGLVPEGARVAPGYQLLARTPVRTRQRYAMRSYPGLAAGIDEPLAVLEAARRIPAGANPRSRELAARWRAEAADGDELAVVRRALEHFRREAFVYTLSPPLLGKNDGIDEFLFATRRGFCEHYAGAFVFLMRAAGIPARVVTGYQGGEPNPVDGYLLVRQSDAHAWAEVWIARRGWMRIDPTAAVSPSRIESGIAAAVPAGDPLPFLVGADAGWLRALRFRWEALGNAWNQWIIGYNLERQRELLTRLGMRDPDWRSAAAAMAVLTGVLLLVLAAWAAHEYRRQDRAARAWAAFSRKMARAGLARRPEEGPLDYARRIAAAAPGLAQRSARIAQLYAELRYGPHPDPGMQRELVLRVRRLKVSA